MRSITLAVCLAIVSCILPGCSRTQPGNGSDSGQPGSSAKADSNSGSASSARDDAVRKTVQFIDQQCTESTKGADKDSGVFRDHCGDPLPRGAVARLGTTRLRHTASWRIMGAAFSPDGKMIASFGGDRCLRVWDTSDGKELQNTPLQSFSDFDATVTFSGDGKTVAVASYKDIALCDIGAAKARILPEVPDYAKGLAIAPDGKLLAVHGHGNTISLIDQATGKELRKLTGHEKRILDVTFSADGNCLASTSEDLTCRIWDVKTGKQQSVLATNKLQAVNPALSPDGKRVAWWDKDGTIHIYDRATEKQETSYKANAGDRFIHERGQNFMGFSPEGTLQAFWWGRHFVQWDPDKGWKAREFEFANREAGFGRIAPDGKMAAYWSWDHGTALHLFDIATGKEKQMCQGHTKPVYGIRAQPRGKLIASTSSDSTIRLWDPADSKELRRWRPESTFHPVVFTPDGKALAFSDYDKKSFIRVVELDTDKQLLRLDTERTHQLAFSANGKLLLTADFTRIEIWDVAKGKLLRELEDVPETKLPPLIISEHAPWLTYSVHSLNMSPDGTKAAAAYVRMGGECSVYLWDTATGKKIAGWPGEKKFNAPLAFSPDDKFLAAVQERGKSDRNVILWDFKKEQIVAQFPIADIACGCIAFSSDGKLLAIGGEYRSTVQIYEIATKKEIARWRPHERLVSLTFSSDGATLVTGGEDSTILVWDLKSDALKK
jgi:WD40 repeat protein